MLTLTFDDEFVAQVEAYAQRTGTDLAALFAEAVRPIIAPERQRRPLSPAIETLAGCIALPPDFDYKKALADWRYEDYERSLAQSQARDEPAGTAQPSA